MDYQVVIDAGHGGSDSGAVSSSGIREKDLTLQIAKEMYDEFQKRGIPAVLIRSTDETISPTDRVNRILAAYGNNPNVIVISNHINAAGSGIEGAEGAEVIYALRNTNRLAENVLNSLQNAGQVARKAYQRRLPSDTSKDYYFIHRNTGNTEPIIVEYGFIDNPTDLNRIQNNIPKYVDAVVDAVVATKRGETITARPLEGTYVVKSGDSLWSIASRYATTVNELKALNNLTSNNLKIGQILKVPTETTAIETNTYVVKSGDSLWSIANRYGTTVNNLKSLNNLTSDVLQIGQVLRVPSSESGFNNEVSNNNTYVVKSGDSLWNIANRYGTTVSKIKSLNGLSSDNLSIGQVLLLPSNIGVANTYTVRSGDSLWSIAKKYNTTVNTLKSLNGLSSNTLSIGQILRLP
ncbi:MAG: LysM peptidoglycan-binding domain-containing protein [Bacilli bacterium]|nr:LysM peptidoglycan-binding domain-containing protein [Bacilli bacterium]